MNGAKSVRSINAGKFLDLIKENPRLYSKKRDVTEDERKEILSDISRKLGLSPDQGDWIWKKLTEGYLNYLKGENNNFHFASKMKFLQSYLLSDVDSDSDDLNDADILEALNSTEDCETRLEIVHNKSGKLTVKTASNTEKVKEDDGGFEDDSLCKPIEDLEDCGESSAKKQRIERNKEHRKSERVSLLVNSKLAKLPESPEHEMHSDALKTMNPLSNFSSLELMFLSYAKTMERMPEWLRYETKYKIVDVMKAAELELIKVHKNK